MNGATNCTSLQSTEGRSDPPVKPTSEVAHQPGQLFALGPDHVADTGDSWYTPHWIFEAAGLTFDLDVAAPIDPTLRTCPANRYLTPIEDGLTAPWEGLVWMNPPYSDPGPWVQRFVSHGCGLALVSATRAGWIGPMLRAADAIALLTVAFLQPGRDWGTYRTLLLMAGCGEVAAGAVGRVAAVDKFSAGAYFVRPGLEQVPEPPAVAQGTLL